MTLPEYYNGYKVEPKTEIFRGETTVTYGYYSEDIVRDNDGNEVGKKRVWHDLPKNESSVLVSLGNDYEMNGPEGAPKALAVFYIGNGTRDTVVPEGTPVFSFYKLVKSYDNVDKNQYNYNNERDYTNTSSSKIVVRWKYVPLFSYTFLYDNDEMDINSMITKRFDEIRMVKGEDDIRIFNPENFIYSNDILKRLVGNGVSVIAFDIEDNMNYEKLQTYNATNADGSSWIVPVKLSNPRCVYVSKSILELSFCQYIDKERFIDAFNQLKEKIDSISDINKEFNQAIHEINDKRQVKINKLQEGLFTWQTTKDKKVKEYQNSVEYTTDTSILDNHTTKIKENNRILQILTSKLTNIKAELELAHKLPFPIIFYNETELSYPKKNKPIFFIDPEFTLVSLMKLICDKSAETQARTGGRKSKKSMNKKLRKKSHQKNTKKYFRRSYRR